MFSHLCRVLPVLAAATLLNWACAEQEPPVTPSAPTVAVTAAELLALDLQWAAAAVAWDDAAEAAREAGATAATVDALRAAAAGARQPVLEHPSGITLQLIPPAELMVGSPLTENHRDIDEAQRTARVDQPFYLGRTEVTQAQYEAVMGTNPSRFVGPERPVDSVSRADAEAFLATLATKHGGTWRLPTEVEWEHACRAGTTTPYHYGDYLTAAQANIRENAGGPTGAGLKDVYRRETVAVAGFDANGFGLFDMHGNVWEWTSGPYAADSGGGSVTKGVLRGGSWNFRPAAARSAARLAAAVDKRWDTNGFRVVLELPPAP